MAEMGEIENRLWCHFVILLSQSRPQIFKQLIEAIDPRNKPLLRSISNNHFKRAADARSIEWRRSGRRAFDTLAQQPGDLTHRLGALHQSLANYNHMVDRHHTVLG